MTLPHENKEGVGAQGEAKEATETSGVTVNGAEDVKVEQASGGDVQADDQGHAAQPADEQQGGDE